MAVCPTIQFDLSHSSNIVNISVQILKYTLNYLDNLCSPWEWKGQIIYLVVIHVMHALVCISSGKANTKCTYTHDAWVLMYAPFKHTLRSSHSLFPPQPVFFHICVSCFSFTLFVIYILMLSLFYASNPSFPICTKII